MDLKKFDKIPEIFENSKEILEKILKVKLTFYGKPGISKTYKISGDFNLGWFGLFNNKFERFVLYLNNYDGKYSSDLLFMSNARRKDYSKRTEVAQKLEDMLEIILPHLEIILYMFYYPKGFLKLQA